MLNIVDHSSSRSMHHQQQNHKFNGYQQADRSRSREASRNHSSTKPSNTVLSSSHTRKKPISERIKTDRNHEKKLEKRRPRVINADTCNKNIVDPRKIAIERLFVRKMQQNQYFKLNLVLDIDETLVSSLFRPEEVSVARSVINGQNVRYSNLRVRLMAGEEPCHILVLYRPKLRFFLENIARYFNIFVYSHGMTKYVIEILNDIDPDCKLINRNNIIANNLKSQVSDSARKCLSKLNLSDKESLKKTLIIDDILNVWLEEYSNNVIISKKYIPFFDISENKAKNQAYYVIFDKEIKQYLCFSPSNSDYYVDRTMRENDGIHQLEKLTNKLLDISFNYNKNMMFCNDGDILDVAFLLDQELHKILSRMSLAINEVESLGKAHMNIQFLTKQLIEKMGGVHFPQAEISKNNEVKFLIVDKDNLEKNKLLVEEIQRIITQEMKEKKREITIVDNRWITDCYFNMSYIDPMRYRVVWNF